MKRIILYLFFFISTYALAEKKENPYANSFTVTLSYSEEGDGSFTVILKNVSEKKLKLMLNTKRLEGTFTLQTAGDIVTQLYNKTYLRLLTTSVWHSGNAELDLKETIEWEVSLNELYYVPSADQKVTKKALEGMSVSFQFQRLAVRKGNIYVNPSSNTIEILPPDKLYTKIFRMGHKEVVALGLLDDSGEFDYKAMKQWLDTKAGESAYYSKGLLTLDATSNKLKIVSSLLKLHRANYKVPTLFSFINKKTEKKTK